MVPFGQLFYNKCLICVRADHNSESKQTKILPPSAKYLPSKVSIDCILSNSEEVEYNASSPDEKALVEGAAYFGFKFIDRHPNTVEVKISGQGIEEYEVLDTIEFTSARKRMLFF